MRERDADPELPPGTSGHRRVEGGRLVFTGWGGGEYRVHDCAGSALEPLRRVPLGDPAAAARYFVHADGAVRVYEFGSRAERGTDAATLARQFYASRPSARRARRAEPRRGLA